MAGYGNRTFAQMTVSIEQKKDFEQWVQQLDTDPGELIDDLTGEGYKITFTYVVDSQSYCISLVGTDLCRVNKDKVLTTWAADPIEALYLSGYKHIVLCNREEWPANDTGSRWG